MREAVRIALVLAAALTVAGCPPPSYGISREFDVARMADIGCIRDAIASVKGASDLHEYEFNAAKDIFGNPTPASRYFMYWRNDGVPASAVLSFEIAPDGRVHVRDVLLGPDEDNMASAITLVHPIMIELEAKLAGKCGVDATAGSFEERKLGATAASAVTNSTSAR